MAAVGGDREGFCKSLYDYDLLAPTELPCARCNLVVRFGLAETVFEAYYSCQVCVVDMQDTGVPFWLAPP
jgi:uncharacterized metal-binding protein YceD (DUF177 family)